MVSSTFFNFIYFSLQISWADIVFVGLVVCIGDFIDISIINKYTKVIALVNEIHNNPGIKAYRAKK